MIHPGGVGDDRPLAPGEVAPVEWIDVDGRQLARTTLTGTRVSDTHLSADDLRQHRVSTGSPAAVLVLQSGEANGGQASIGRELGTVLDRAIAEVTLGDANDLPRSIGGYGPYKVVAIGESLDAMDVAQQLALLDYVRQGGSLLVWGDRAEYLRNTWLSPLLPVSVLGSRRASVLHVDQSTKPIQLSNEVNQVDAVERKVDDGVASHIELQDGDFVHAIERPLGLGRIIFTSVPPATLDATNPAVRAAWRTLLPNDFDSPGVEGPIASATADRLVLSELLGRAAPSLSLPAAVVGGYMLLAVVVHLVFHGSRRPIAYVIILGGAVLMTAGLFADTALRRREPVLSVARITAIDLGPDGTGRMVEQDAFVGSASKSFAATQAPLLRIAGWPGAFDSHNAPVVRPFPFAVVDPQVREDGFDRTWQLAKTFDGGPVQLAAQFSSDGLHLRGRQSIPGTIADPALSWGVSFFRLPELRNGDVDARVTADSLNPPGVYTNGSGMIGNVDRVRGELLQGWSQGRSTDDLNATVVGWPSFAASPPLLETTDGDIKSIVNAQTLLRVPVTIEPSTVGSTVKIEGSFNRAGRVADAAIPPLDALRSADGNQPSDWVMAVVPPAGIGKLRPTHATVSIELDTPQHVVTVQAGQFPVAPANASSFNPVLDAPLLAAWTHAIGHEEVSFNVKPTDLSPAGLLVLRFSIQPTGGAAAPSARWAVHSLRITIEAAVVSH